MSEGLQQFLTNRTNEAASATITPSATKSADDNVLPLKPARTSSSSGIAKVKGPYTGNLAETQIDVKIVNSVGSQARASKPVFVGAGNGQLIDAAATGAVPSQKITAVLKQLGTKDKTARIEITGVPFVCKRVGIGGNTLSFTVDDSGLTFTDSSSSLLESISEGDSRFTGLRFDFGGLPLTAQGNIRDETPRIAFNPDPRVYRQYIGSDGAYYIDPPLERDINAGSIVQTVTGSYSVTLSTSAGAWQASTAVSKGQWINVSGDIFEAQDDGVTDGSIPTFDTAQIENETTDNTVTWIYVFAVASETFTNIVTSYDLIVALLSSRFIEPDTTAVIVQDKTPGGLAAEDMPLRSDAFSLGSIKEGSDELIESGELLEVDVQNATTTEEITIQCIGNNVVGSEIWRVKGSNSGLLANAVTNSLYSQSGIQFKVKRFLPESSILVQSEFGPRVSAVNFQANDGINTEFPTVCLNRYAYGVNVKQKTFKFTYQRKPSANCGCATVVTQGNGPLSECLGVEIGGLNVTTASYTYHSRQSNLMDWFADKVESNTSLSDGRHIRSDATDLEVLTNAKNAYLNTLALIHTDSNATLDSELSAWQTSTAYAEGAEVIDGSNQIFQATVGGTSHASTEPTWPTTFGATVTDNDITWTYVRKAPLALWDTYLTGLKTALDALDGQEDLAIGSWIASSEYSVGYIIRPATPNGYLYMAVHSNASVTSGGGTSGGSEPTWPTTVGNEVTDNELIWRCVFDDTGATILNRGVGSEIHGNFMGQSIEISEFIKRYNAQMADVQAASGLTLGKTDAGEEQIGSPCWQDRDDEYYWSVNDGELLPYWTNVQWHSAKSVYDPETGETSIVSTKEVWFDIAIGCTGNLTVGDTFSITVDINDVEENKAYKIGDAFKLSVVAGTSALDLAEGASGNNADIWAILGSISGAFSDYSVERGNEAAYSDSGLSFKILAGDNDNAVGDRWSFELTRLQYQWRQDAASYSSSIDFPASSDALIDGLTLEFDFSDKVLSFENDDVFSFKVIQPYSSAHSVVSDGFSAWASGATAYDIVYDFGSDKDIKYISVLMHKITESASITFELLNAADSVLYSSNPAWKEFSIVDILTSETSARKLKISVTSGSVDDNIGFVYCGIPECISVDAEECRIFPDRLMQEGGNSRIGSKFLGKGHRGQLTWSLAGGTTGGFTVADYNILQAIYDYLKENNDEPFGLVPNFEIEEAFYLVWGSDTFEAIDLRELSLSPDEQDAREFSLAVDLEPVYQY